MNKNKMLYEMQKVNNDLRWFDNYLRNELKEDFENDKNFREEVQGWIINIEAKVYNLRNTVFGKENNE